MRRYPFVFSHAENKFVLCVDEESGLLLDDGAKGEEFFGLEGNLSPALQQMLEFLTAVERSRAGTDLAVAALELDALQVRCDP